MKTKSGKNKRGNGSAGKEKKKKGPMPGRHRIERMKFSFFQETVPAFRLRKRCYDLNKNENRGVINAKVG